MESSTVVTLVVGIGTLCGVALAFLTFWLNFSGRVSDANSRAETASKQASSATSRVITVEKELTDLRVEVARDYVSNNKLDAMEKRVVDAISGLGARIDHAFAKGN